MNNSSQWYVGTRAPLPHTQNNTAECRADSRLSDIFNYKHEAVTPSKQQGQDWSEEVEPNEQSQQAAKKKKTVVL